jgi:hypothetical protein
VIEKDNSRVGMTCPAETELTRDTGFVANYAIDMACSLEKAKCVKGRSR